MRVANIQHLADYLVASFERIPDPPRSVCPSSRHFQRPPPCASKLAPQTLPPEFGVSSSGPWQHWQVKENHLASHY
jgi:hypothetical protein